MAIEKRKDRGNKDRPVTMRLPSAIVQVLKVLCELYGGQSQANLVEDLLEEKFEAEKRKDPAAVREAEKRLDKRPRK